ncbi:hypothetical protein [Paenibacillus sp. Soil522]|uniref:hypothetical protein n=1 Tax=Paenibacillus sp. Soil522 TaxID=1736388 RepID=UPI0012DE5E61|nr:hypothetical protein [Paenibacillus sp. Soil522]
MTSIRKREKSITERRARRWLAVIIATAAGNESQAVNLFGVLAAVGGYRANRTSPGFENKGSLSSADL